LVISLQTSQGGAAYFAGKGIKNSAEKQEASVAGAIAAAHYIRSVAPLYGVPVVRMYIAATQPLPALCCR
jgi:fructose-bisphosphate aldolase class II